MKSIKSLASLIELFDNMVNEVEGKLYDCPYLSPVELGWLLEKLHKVELSLINRMTLLDERDRFIKKLEKAKERLEIEPNNSMVHDTMFMAIDFINKYYNYQPQTLHTITSLLSTTLDPANDTKDKTTKIKLKTEFINGLINILKA